MPIRNACYFWSPSLDISNCKGGWEIRSSCVSIREKKQQIGGHVASLCHGVKGLKEMTSAKKSEKNVLDRGKDMCKGSVYVLWTNVYSSPLSIFKLDCLVLLLLVVVVRV